MITIDELHQIFTAMGYSHIEEEGSMVQYRDPLSPIRPLRFDVSNPAGIPKAHVDRTLDYEGVNRDVFWAAYASL